ncbi:HtaA domain-containing protein [Leucobacter sp. OH1287]|uniref:HtaA domain-containing protein n=1 Tax=Leucobacter sp. OH1287 TaxID=2491049 RepID=UPI000F5E6F4A|nr:HtaA domain-containing protein [Leucobacter sp. OH1287]RRD59579.1 hypothetical protein EII30_08445 [Leucobacter sp. OH1287]
MKPRNLSTAAAVIVVAGALTITPLSAHAAASGSAKPLNIAPAVQTADTCELTSGNLDWGFKESFRAYISGSIAKGSWEASEGAVYETPLFKFPTGSGSVTAETQEVRVTFPGKIHFTGHNGVLDMTVANPTVVIPAEGTEGKLLLDLRSTDTSGELAIDQQAVEALTLDLSKGLKVTDDGITINDAPATVTETGATAFGGFYNAGEEFDPINLTAAGDGCVKSTLHATAADDSADEKTADSADDKAADSAAKTPTPGTVEVPLAALIIGAISLPVIGFTAGMLLTGRKRKQAENASTSAV